MTRITNQITNATMDTLLYWGHSAFIVQGLPVGAKWAGVKPREDEDGVYIFYDTAKDTPGGRELKKIGLTWSNSPYGPGAYISLD